MKNRDPESWPLCSLASHCKLFSQTLGAQLLRAKPHAMLCRTATSSGKACFSRQKSHVARVAWACEQAAPKQTQGQAESQGKAHPGGLQRLCFGCSTKRDSRRRSAALALQDRQFQQITLRKLTSPFKKLASFAHHRFLHLCQTSGFLLGFLSLSTKPQQLVSQGLSGATSAGA